MVQQQYKTVLPLIISYGRCVLGFIAMLFVLDVIISKANVQIPGLSLGFRYEVQIAWTENSTSPFAV